MNRNLDTSTGTQKLDTGGAREKLKGGLSFKHLLVSEESHSLVLEEVRAIATAARAVIEGNLAAGLDLATLRSLQASVLRQQSDARMLHVKLGSGAAQDEVFEDLDAFFERVLATIAHRIGGAH